MPPLLRASVGVHAFAAGVGLAVPGAWPWALGGVGLNHALLAAAGLWPRSAVLGPNVSRLPAAGAARGEVALTIDDGPDPQVTPYVLDLLDRCAARATFFCIAERALAAPALTREIVARGHDVQNHSAHHRHHFALLGPRGYRREISLAQQRLADITGIVPTFFRAPAGLRNPFLDPVLHRLGLTLVSWTRRGYDTRERNAAVVAARLTRGLAGGDILLLHDGNAARDAAGRPVLLDALELLLARCRDAGLHTVTLANALPPRGAAGSAVFGTAAIA